MTAQSFQNIVLSMATYVGPSGATAAATYGFFTRDYEPPQQDRYIDKDIVKNQNGKFKYLYDNGPGWKRWSPFKIVCEDSFATLLGAMATVQFQRLHDLWTHPGVLQMRAPEATYTVHWGDSMERSFRVFPKRNGDQQEFEVVVQFEEGQ